MFKRLLLSVCCLLLALCPAALADFPERIPDFDVDELYPADEFVPYTNAVFAEADLTLLQFFSADQAADFAALVPIAKATGDRLRVIGVLVSGGADPALLSEGEIGTVGALLEEAEVPYPVVPYYHAFSELLALFPEGLPFTFLVGREGNLIDATQDTLTAEEWIQQAQSTIDNVYDEPVQLIQ